jgi:hypothetical protein
MHRPANAGMQPAHACCQAYIRDSLPHARVNKCGRDNSSLVGGVIRPYKLVSRGNRETVPMVHRPSGSKKAARKLEEAKEGNAHDD